MSREFSKIAPVVWRSKRFVALDSFTKLTLLYLIASEHQNSSGCCRLPDAYAAADLGCTADEFTAARQRLASVGLIMFDEETSEIYVTGWYNFNVPRGPKQRAGTALFVSNIESDALREQVEADFDAAYSAWEASTQRSAGSNLTAILDQRSQHRR